MAAADGLFIKGEAPTILDTPNQITYYSGSKSSYGVNCQATCTADYRFCNVSVLAPGASNDWVAWNRSGLATAVGKLPKGFHIIGDAAYPLSEQLLTPYPGKNLPKDKDSYNFHLSQLRVKIEQSFGILVATWGILWRPLRVKFAGRGDLIIALFHLHNFLRDEGVEPVRMAEETIPDQGVRPVLAENGSLPAADYETEQEPNPEDMPLPSRSGETPTRLALTLLLDNRRQYRPEYNLARNL